MGVICAWIILVMGEGDIQYTYHCKTEMGDTMNECIYQHEVGDLVRDRCGTSILNKKESYTIIEFLCTF